MYALTALSLAAGVFGATMPEKRQAIGVTFEDTFNNLPPGHPVGSYDGIEYGGVIVERPNPDGASIQPPTPPNYAGAATELDAIQLGSFVFNSYAQLVKASNVTAFDLSSFYFACAIDDGSTYSAAQGCDISVVGYTVQGSQVPVVSFSYTPEKVVNAPFVKATLPSTYSNLANVSIGVANGAIFTERTTIGLDDIVHTNYVV